MATRFRVLTLPTLRKRRMTVTVSPRSIAPLAGPLSAVKVAPAATMLTKGAATTVVVAALLLAGLGSVCAPTTVAVVVSVPVVEVRPQW